MENNNLEWQVNKTLNSLDGIQRATANPFLYTRVKAAIDEQNGVWAKFAGIFSRPAYALTMATLFIGLNVWVAFNRPQQEPVAKSIADGEQAIAAELATVNYNMLDLNSNDK
jgi:hypothetical protein